LKKKDKNGWNFKPKSTMLDFQEKKCFKKPMKREKRKAVKLKILNCSKRKSCCTRYVRRRTTSVRKGDESLKLHVA